MTSKQKHQDAPKKQPRSIGFMNTFSRLRDPQQAHQRSLRVLALSRESRPTT